VPLPSSLFHPVPNGASVDTRFHLLCAEWLTLVHRAQHQLLAHKRPTFLVGKFPIFCSINSKIVWPYPSERTPPAKTKFGSSRASKEPLLDPKLVFAGFRALEVRCSLHQHAYAHVANAVGPCMATTVRLTQVCIFQGTYNPMLRKTTIVFIPS
jgi:hypothetical protein